MKKSALYFFLMLIIFSTNLLAQRSLTFDREALIYRNALKINLLSPLLFTLNVSHEYRSKGRLGYQNGLAYTNFYRDEQLNRITSFKGIQYTFDLRIYNKNASRWSGMYAGIFGRFSAYENRFYCEEPNNAGRYLYFTEKISGISIGLCAGYQKSFRNKFIMDLFAGIYRSYPTRYSIYPGNPPGTRYGEYISFKANPYTNGIGLRPGIKLGYLF